MSDTVTAAATPIELTAENTKDKLKEITDKLEAGIKGLFESDQYAIYLKTLSKFHNYSFNNCILIAMQKPDATHIAGYTAWQQNFKRQVMKGEKGIKIIAPAPYKMKKEQEKIDPATQRPIIGKDGKPITEEVEITIPAFKVVSVFDVSQTDGEPLPEIGVNELTGDVDKFNDFYKALEKTSPAALAIEDITSGAKGYYNQMEKRIALNAGMSELQTLKTAIHEIAHARLHDIDKNAPKEVPRPDKATREVEAESVAYTVCAHYGLDTSDYSFSYIAGWSGNKELGALLQSLETIRAEAGSIINEVDKHFSELQQDKTQTAERPAPAVGDTFTMDKPEDYKAKSLSMSDFLAPKEQMKTLAAEKPVDFTAVADYMNKIRDSAIKADPDKTQGAAAFRMAIKRLEQSNERIPGEHPQLKALITHVAQSPDLATLKERMNTMHSEFIQHYATAPQMAIDTGSKAQPPAPAASQPTAVPEKAYLLDFIADPDNTQFAASKYSFDYGAQRSEDEDELEM
jgi:antirestriction protein ArdC